MASLAVKGLIFLSIFDIGLENIRVSQFSLLFHKHICKYGTKVIAENLMNQDWENFGM